MILGFLFSNVLYLVVAILQLMAVCFDVILWASILAFLPMLARSSIHCAWAVGLEGKGGMLMFLIDWRASMSGLFCRCVWGWVHAARIALRMLWWIFN